MKKTIVILMLILFSLMMFIPSVSASNTLGDLKYELQKLKDEKSENEAAKNKTQAEINAENNKITNAHADVEQAQSDIAAAKKKIEQSNEQIASVKDKSAEVLVFYQIMMGDDSAMKYVGTSTSVTDLVMRAEAISQVLDYNKQQLNSLENLIVENENLQVELAKKQEDLNEKIKIYEKSLASLKDDLSSLVEVTLDIDQQIQAQKELIDYYQKIGCKDDQDIDECVSIAGTARWMKPTDRGYVSSGFGWRSFILNGAPYSDYHPAVDIAGNAGGTPVYAAANGYIAAVISKASCGGNQVYIHSIVQGVKYTVSYAHLLNVYVSVGDKVTQQTVIGTVGGGGSTLKAYGGWDTCSTGYHLHFGITKGFYLSKCNECYSSYSQYIANSIVPPFMPAYGSWYYSRI